MTNSELPIDPGEPVMVTGSSGFIGSRIVRRLLMEGVPVAAMVEELSSQHLHLLDLALGGRCRDRVPLFVCDLHVHHEALAIVEQLRPGACIHTAWNVKPGEYRDSPDNDRWVETSLRLFEALLNNGCTWLCVLGTCFETAQSNEANTAYARAKATLRHEAQKLFASRPDSQLCWLHIFQPYGPGERPARLFPALIEACIGRRPFIIETGTSVRDFIHVDDIARAICLALQSRAGGLFDVGTGRGRSVSEVAEWIAELLESRDLLQIHPPPNAAPSDVIIANPAPLEKAAGWRPRIDFAAAIKHEIAEAMIRPDVRKPADAPACPLCGRTTSTPICAAVDQPAMLNVLHRTRDEAARSRRRRLRFLGCRHCGFVFNECFDPQSVTYTPEYVNDQTHSSVFMEHSRTVRNRLVEIARSQPGRIIELGCGQGGFLRTLCEQSGRSGIGCDPACTNAQSDPTGVALIAQEFTAGHAETLAGDRQATSLICCRHVLEHLPDPLRMLRAIRLIAAPNAVVYLETPSFDWIARRGAFFDFFNEHCSLFTADSLRFALATAGLTAKRITEAFGGQYLCVEAVAGRTTAPASEIMSCEAPVDFATIARRMNRQRRRIAELFDDAAARGSVFVWGAAGKGVSLAAHLGLGRRRVPYFIDINPDKQGRYVPITAQRVIAPEDLPGLPAGLTGDATIAVTNPNYADEIAGSLKAMKVRAGMIVLTEKDRVDPYD